MVNSQETLSVDSKDSDVVTDKFQLLRVAILEDYTDWVNKVATHAKEVELDAY
jgi:hypothetical protein